MIAHILRKLERARTLLFQQPRRWKHSAGERCKQTGHSWGGGFRVSRQDKPRRTFTLEKLVLQIIKKKDVASAKRTLSAIFRSKLLGNEDLMNLLIEMFGKNSCPEEARLVFDKLEEPGKFSWHFMVQAYARNGYLEEAQSVFDRMPKPTAITTATRNILLGAYIGQGRLVEAKQLFDWQWVPDTVSWCILFVGYIDNGLLDGAKCMLEKMPRRIDVAWNTMIQAYLKKGYLVEAKETFDAMPNKNVLSYSIMVTGFARNGQLQEAKRLFDQVPEMDAGAWNEMIIRYAQNGYLKEAKMMFDRIPHRRSLASCTALIQAYGRTGKVAQAKEIFDRMEPDLVATNSMLTVYAQNGKLQEARVIFQKTTNRNVVTWTNMIQGYIQKNDIQEAKKLFDRMPFDCVVASTAMVAAYARLGHMEEAKLMFDKMTVQNVITWTVMIVGYAQHGQPKDALGFFGRMDLEGAKPDDFTFTALLTACRHAGLLNKARGYFISMSPDYGLTPGIEHYHCMIDILGHAAKLKEAEELINNMPFVPDGTAWTSLLGACKTHGDVERAKQVAKHVIDAEPGTASPYVLLSNVVATSYLQESSDLLHESTSVDSGEFGAATTRATMTIKRPCWRSWIHQILHDLHDLPETE